MDIFKLITNETGIGEIITHQLELWSISKIEIRKHYVISMVKIILNFSTIFDS